LRVCIGSRDSQLTRASLRPFAHHLCGAVATTMAVEIKVSGNTVQLLRSGSRLEQYTLSGPVLKAVFCSLLNSGRDALSLREHLAASTDDVENASPVGRSRYLAVLHSGSRLHTFPAAEDAAHDDAFPSEMTLPFAASDLFGLPTGLLIVRDPAYGVHAGATHGAAKWYYLPALYRQPSPVWLAFPAGDAEASDNEAAAAVQVDAAESLVVHPADKSGPAGDFAVTFNSRTGKHSLWGVSLLTRRQPDRAAPTILPAHASSDGVASGAASIAAAGGAVPGRQWPPFSASLASPALTTGSKRNSRRHAVSSSADRSPELVSPAAEWAVPAGSTIADLEPHVAGTYRQVLRRDASRRLSGLRSGAALSPFAPVSTAIAIVAAGGSAANTPAAALPRSPFRSPMRSPRGHLGSTLAAPANGGPMLAAPPGSEAGLGKITDATPARPATRSRARSGRSRDRTSGGLPLSAAHEVGVTPQMQGLHFGARECVSDRNAGTPADGRGGWGAESADRAGVSTSAASELAGGVEGAATPLQTKEAGSGVRSRAVGDTVAPGGSGLVSAGGSASLWLVGPDGNAGSGAGCVADWFPRVLVPADFEADMVQLLPPLRGDSESEDAAGGSAMSEHGSAAGDALVPSYEQLQLDSYSLEDAECVLVRLWEEQDVTAPPAAGPPRQADRLFFTHHPGGVALHVLRRAAPRSDGSSRGHAAGDATMDHGATSCAVVHMQRAAADALQRTTLLDLARQLCMVGESSADCCVLASPAAATLPAASLQRQLQEEMHPRVSVSILDAVSWDDAAVLPSLPARPQAAFVNGRDPAAVLALVSCSPVSLPQLKGVSDDPRDHSRALFATAAVGSKRPRPHKPSQASTEALVAPCDTSATTTPSYALPEGSGSGLPAAVKFTAEFSPRPPLYESSTRSSGGAPVASLALAWMRQGKVVGWFPVFAESVPPVGLVHSVDGSVVHLASARPASTPVSMQLQLVPASIAPLQRMLVCGDTPFHRLLQLLRCTSHANLLPAGQVGDAGSAWVAACLDAIAIASGMATVAAQLPPRSGAGLQAHVTVDGDARSLVVQLSRPAVTAGTATIQTLSVELASEARFQLPWGRRCPLSLLDVAATILLASARLPLTARVHSTGPAESGHVAIPLVSDLSNLRRCMEVAVPALRAALEDSRTLLPTCTGGPPTRAGVDVGFVAVGEAILHACVPAAAPLAVAHPDAASHLVEGLLRQAAAGLQSAASALTPAWQAESLRLLREAELSVATTLCIAPRLRASAWCAAALLASVYSGLTAVERCSAYPQLALAVSREFVRTLQLRGPGGLPAGQEDTPALATLLLPSVRAVLHACFRIADEVPAPLHWGAPAAATDAVRSAGVDAANMLSLAVFNPGHAGSRSASLASGGRDASGALAAALSHLFVPAPAGAGLGVLAAQGIAGRPPSDALAAAAGVAAGVLVSRITGTPECPEGAPPGDDTDGIGATVFTLSQRRFPRDRRLRSIARHLQSSRPRWLFLLREPEASDHAFLRLQASSILYRGRATMAAGMGRAALTAASVLPAFADPVPVPPLTLACRLPPLGTLARVDASAITSFTTGIFDWAEFHNGFAAGMRLDVGPALLRWALRAAHGEQRQREGAAGGDGEEDGGSAAWGLGGAGGSGAAQEGSSTLLPSGGFAFSARAPFPAQRLQLSALDKQRVRAWIRSHRFTGVPPDLGAVTAAAAALSVGQGGAITAAGAPQAGLASGVVPPNPAQAGLLFSFGLQGLLGALTKEDLYEHTRDAHALTTMATLLGTAVSRRGSMDALTHKAIALHLPALLMPGVRGHDLELPTGVQDVALLAMGFLYCRSQHRPLTQFLLDTLPTEPASTHVDDRDTYSMCCGFALGLLHLAQGAGSAAALLAPPAAASVGGAAAPPLAPAAAGAGSGGSGLLAADASAVLERDNALIRLLLGGDDPAVGERQRALVAAARVDPSRASVPDAVNGYARPVTVWEAERVNTIVTAAPAALALTLTYMQTDERRIADALSLPQSLVALDELRFDSVMLRVAGRALVMWGEHDEDDADRHFHYPAWLARYRRQHAQAAAVLAASPADGASAAGRVSRPAATPAAASFAAAARGVALQPVPRSLSLHSPASAPANPLSASGSGDAAASANLRVPGPLEARARWEQRRRNRVRRWVRSQVPAVVRRLMRRLYAQAVHTGSGNAQAMLMARIMAPAAAGGPAAKQAEAQAALPAPPQQPSRSPQLSPASAGAPTPRGGAARGAAAAPGGDSGGRLLRTLPGIVVDARDGPLEEVDDEQVKTVYAQCVAGACAALGLRYAGTGDAVVRDEILGHLAFACALREADSRDGYVFLERLLFGCTLLEGAEAVERGNALFAELMDGGAPAAAAGVGVGPAQHGAGPSPQHGSGGAMSVSPASSSPSPSASGSSPTLPPSPQASPRRAAMRASAAAAAVNRMLLPAHETEPAADELVSAMAHRHPAWPLRLEAPGGGGGGSSSGATRCLRAATLSPLDKRIRSTPQYDPAKPGWLCGLSPQSDSRRKATAAAKRMS